MQEEKNVLELQWLSPNGLEQMSGRHKDLKLILEKSPLELSIQ